MGFVKRCETTGKNELPVGAVKEAVEICALKSS